MHSSSILSRLEIHALLVDSTMCFNIGVYVFKGNDFDDILDFTVHSVQILLKPFSNLQLTSEGKFKWVDGNFLDNAYPLFIKKKF